MAKVRHQEGPAEGAARRGLWGRGDLDANRFLRRWAAVLVFGLVAPAFAGEKPAESPFRFKTPEGWLPCTSEHVALMSVGSLPPESLEAALEPACEEAECARMTATVFPKAARISKAFLNEQVAALVSNSGAVWPGSTASVVEVETTKVAGIAAGRVVLDWHNGEVKKRQLIYLVPGGSHTAVVSYVAPAARFVALLPVFESSIAGTQGAQSAPFSFGAPGPVFLLIGIALGIGHSLRESRRKKRLMKSRPDEVNPPVEPSRPEQE